MKKEELNDCLKVFYAAVKQKDGKDFKVSSLRAAIERYLKQPLINKPWSIVGDPVFETANKVLNAICRKNAQEGKASPIVQRQPISNEQVEQLFRTGQLGENVTHKIPHSCCALPGSTSPCILVKEAVRIKESLQKKCRHSSQPPRLPILWA